MADEQRPDEDDTRRSRSSSAGGDARAGRGDRGRPAARDAAGNSAPRRDGDRRRAAPRSGAGSRPGAQGGDRKPFVKRDGERKPYASRDGERKPFVKRDGERKPYASRDGVRKPYVKRDGDRSSAAAPSGGRKPYPKRDGDRYPPSRGGSDRRAPGSPRDERVRPERTPEEEALRPVRSRHDDPPIPDEVVAADLDRAARNELKTLSKENADWVARHLAMAAALIEEDPALAHQHALSAARRAGRIAVVRETAAITAYATGDFALALRELRTYRRISGRDDQIALMVDSERGVGRPDRALEVGRSVDRSRLDAGVRVELAIAMSGARLDLGEAERALLELDIPELDPTRAYSWSAGLFAARAVVLDELGRTEEADRWRRFAEIAEEAVSGDGSDDVVVVDEIEEDAADDDRLPEDGAGVEVAVGPDAVAVAPSDAGPPADETSEDAVPDRNDA